MSCTVVSSSGLGEYLAGFPCPYDSVLDPGPALPALVQAAGIQGLGDYLPAVLAFYPQNLQAKGLGCGCAGIGCGCSGLGLFDSMDFTTWGWQEWAIVIFAGYAIISLAMDTKSGVGRITKGARKRSSKRKKVGEARERLTKAQKRLQEAEG
jgi:hypothetical protein